MRDKIENVLSEIRPFLRTEGGEIEFVNITDDGVLIIKVTGICVNCPGPMLPLKDGLESLLRERIPEVTKVIVV